MSRDEETTDLPARFAALSEMDGDEWDAEHERIETEWRAAYGREFGDFAVSRNWSHEDAENCQGEISHEAFLNCCDHDYCPRLAVQADVIECGWESHNAC